MRKINWSSIEKKFDQIDQVIDIWIRLDGFVSNHDHILMLIQRKQQFYLDLENDDEFYEENFFEEACD